jgi:GAF domain-containing protein
MMRRSERHETFMASGPEVSARNTATTSEQWRYDRATTTTGQCHSRPASVRLNVAIHDQLLSAVGGRRGVEAADRLCEACVLLFDVDAAAISLVFDGASSGTLGVSSAPARVYDELQFTLGEGPCLDSVSHQAPVLVADLADPDDNRWPIYGPALLSHQIRGVFAMPVIVAGEHIGALDLFRAQPGRLEEEHLTGAFAAAELAGVPLLDVMNADLYAAVNDPESNAWAELHALSRTEVSQATGMIVAQLGVEPAEALVRLRAHAYATGRSSTDVARDILDRRLRLEAD